MSLIVELRRQGNFLFRHRGWLPAPILGLGLGLFAFTQGASPEDLVRWGEALGRALATAGPWISLLGLLVRVLTVGHTPANTSGRNTTAGQVAATLNVTGMYAMVRHPLYVGNFLMWIGVACLTQSATFVLGCTLGFWLYYERIMFAEESFLLEQFGPAYGDWSARTPAFWPALGQWTKPALPFSWRNAVKRETTGLYTLVVVVAAFEVVGALAATGGLMPPARQWLVVAAIATVLTLAVRWVRKRTTWLDVAGR